MPNYDDIQDLTLEDMVDLCTRCVRREGGFRRPLPDWWVRDGRRMCGGEERYHELSCILGMYPERALPAAVRLYYEDLQGLLELADEYPPNWLTY